MIQSALVPLDGSARSREVLTQASPLLARPGLQVELLGVVSPEDSWWEDEPPPEHQLADVRRGLVEAGRPLEDAGAFVTCSVARGDPATRILERAAALRPSLVAMTTHGRRGPSRWLRGSVAERVLRASPAPVLLVNAASVLPSDPASERPAGGPAVRRILVPLDGSELAAAVLPLAQEVALAFGAELLLLRVAPFEQRDREHEALDLAIALSEAARAPRDAGLRVELLVGFGLPAAQILESAEERHADLVAMATHARKGVARWLLGSVTAEVLRACPRPLLVWPVTAAPASGAAWRVTSGRRTGSP
ncbi:MAG: universal stress protein [Planctomycetota bacterium]